MKTTIKKYLKYFLVFLSISSIIFIVFMTKGQQNNLPTPTSIPQVKFEFIRTTPSGGNVSIPIPNLSIEFAFSKKVDLSSLSVKIYPKIDFDFNLGNNKQSIFVFPQKNWSYNTKYTITLNIQSIDGEVLENPIVYMFTPTQLKNSSMNEENFKY